MTYTCWFTRLCCYKSSIQKSKTNPKTWKALYCLCVGRVLHSQRFCDYFDSWPGQHLTHYTNITLQGIHKASKITYHAISDILKEDFFHLKMLQKKISEILNKKCKNRQRKKLITPVKVHVFYYVCTHFNILRCPRRCDGDI